MERFYFNEDTKEFSMEKFGTGLGIAATAIGAVSGVVGLKKMLDNPTFSVVFLNSNNVPSSKTIKAPTPIAAINKVSQVTKGSKFKAFRMPDQDDQSQEYYNSLSR